MLRTFNVDSTAGTSQFLFPVINIQVNLDFLLGCIKCFHINLAKQSYLADILKSLGFHIRLHFKLLNFVDYEQMGNAISG